MSVSWSHSLSCLAAPFNDHVFPGGPVADVPVTPLPVNVIARSPPPSLPLMVHVSERLPVAVGAKATFSVTVAPGAITVASGSDVVALNPMPPAGGFDFVIKRADPPVFLIVNDRDATPPTNVGPNATVVGVNAMTGGGAAVPDIGRSRSPADGWSVSTSSHEPTTAGENVPVTTTDASDGITAPAAGRPLTANGAAGRSMLLIVTSVAPTFAMLADRVTGVPPAAAPPKLITGGVASSNPVGLIRTTSPAR